MSYNTQTTFCQHNSFGGGICARLRGRIFNVYGVIQAWAGTPAGKLLISFAPAGKMEQFFRDNLKSRKDGEYLNDAEVYRAYGRPKSPIPTGQKQG